MKKRMTLFAIALFVFSLSGQAMAYFEEQHLIRIVYDADTEIATDLGAGWDLTSPYTGTHVFNTNNFSLAALGATDWSTVNVAYFIMEVDQWDGLTANQAWVSGPTTGGQSSMFNMFDTLAGQATLANGMNGLTGNAQNVYLKSDPKSYNTVLNPLGTFRGFLSANNGVANLAALNTGGSVEQYLYYYGNPNAVEPGVPLMKLTTNADGTTTASAASAVVPIPAAVYLLGSGLLGLVGIRRRMAA